jgi:probable phosphoglycerate mutase
MTATRFILTRHGETQWNLEQRMQGHQDSQLTGLGRQQAEALARRLEHEAFDHLYSSDLGRCQKTAQTIAAVTGHAINLDPRLRERNLGIVQGLSFSMVSDRYPDVSRAMQSYDPDYVVPEGESYRMVLQRALASLDDLARKHPGEQILIVSHGGVLNILFKHLLGIPLQTTRSFRVHNAGLNVVMRYEANWMVETLGDVSHLKVLYSRDELLR